MVTRYTIDQILSCNNNDEDHLEKPFSPSGALATPPITPCSPSSPKSFTLFKDAVTLRDETTNTPQTLQDYPENLSKTSPSFEKPRGEETKAEDFALLSRDKPSVTTYDPASHVVARPVPVRPAASRPNGPMLDRASISSSVAPPGSDGLCNGVGYSLPNGLAVENNFYTLMFRHYVEAQLRGLANSRSYGPLAYPMLDPALPHLVGGAPLPYPLTSRSRRRGGQVRFTGDQTRQLESWFHLHKYINPSQRKTIARELNLQERQVKTWFQNRRAKWRKLEAQPGAEIAPSPTSSHEGSGDDVKDDLNDNALEEDLEVQDEEEEESSREEQQCYHKDKRLRGSKPPEDNS